MPRKPKYTKVKTDDPRVELELNSLKKKGYQFGFYSKLGQWIPVKNLELRQKRRSTKWLYHEFKGAVVPIVWLLKSKCVLPTARWIDHLCFKRSPNTTSIKLRKHLKEKYNIVFS